MADAQNYQNHLIDLLPAEDRRRLLDVCEPVPLVMTERLYEPDDLAGHVYFPLEGFISLVAVVDHHPGIEVAMVGREGLLGAQVALGVASAPLRAVVQGPGRAWRVASADFQRELGRSEALKRGLGRYIHVLMSQLGTAAACMRFHPIAPRLARWLLMSQDRAQASTFGVTHEFLATMLGVRRVGVTLAAGDLQLRGLIRYRRGALTVCDRAGLESAACSCYRADQRTYAALLS